MDAAPRTHHRPLARPVKRRRDHAAGDGPRCRAGEQPTFLRAPKHAAAQSGCGVAAVPRVFGSAARGMWRNRPPEPQLRRYDPHRAALSHAGTGPGSVCGTTARSRAAQPAVHRGRRSHTRANLLRACHAEPAPVKGALRAACAVAALDRCGPGAALRPQVRRVGTPPGSRYTAGAGGGIRVAALAVPPPRSSTVAAAPQRVSGGPIGRFQHGQTRCRTGWTVEGNARRVRGDALPAAVPGRLGRRLPSRAPRRPPVSPHLGGVG